MFADDVLLRDAALIDPHSDDAFAARQVAVLAEEPRERFFGESHGVGLGDNDLGRL